MSFLPNEPDTFINIKLTDTGRKLLSLGALTFDKAALSDREINYGFHRQISGAYDLQNNRVITPKDNHPTFTNFDGSDFLTLGSAQIKSAKQIVSAQTQNTGFFTGDVDNGFSYDLTKNLTSVRITYSAATSLPNGTNIISYDLGSNTNLLEPQAGDLIYIPWEPIQNSGKTFDDLSTLIDSNNATNHLWYRILDVNTNELTLDRPTPNFGITTLNQTIKAYIYPFNGIETYYSTLSTVDVGVWNMNIVRTSNVIGTAINQSGYTSYGSIEFNGAKTFFGFSSETKCFGLIHYTNLNSGNTYAESFVEKTVELNLPNIMWHNTNADVGKGVKMGLTLYDSYGDTLIDSANNATYRILRDGTSSNNINVGRVYHDLKMIIITDTELLTALSYKANRNFTLPKLQLSLVSSPKYPLTTSQATGLCNSGKTYYVTYNIESENQYIPGVSFGYPQTLPCSYVSKITGELDSNGNPTYLNINFPPKSFPFMRSSDDMNPNGVFSGTGWNANKIQILVNEVDNNSNYDYDTIPSHGWVLMSSGSEGNGIYTGETTDTTINPLKLQGYQFTVSREDYVSGSTFTLNNAFTDNIDITQSGLTFGNESFFFGTLKTAIKASVFKTSITVLANNISFNSSNNPTFDSILDQNTYITEIGIFNANNELVAIGKPTYPLKKSDGRFLAFKLEYDF